MHLKKLTAGFIALIFFTGLCRSDESYTPSAENMAMRHWFQDAKFGLFIHWGIYSVLGEHEWVMETRKIDKATYEKLAPFFNPTEFDANAWVKMAKSAGMKYVTITAKHHDGFAMYNSSLTDWDISDRTVYKKDVIKEMAKACKKHGLKLFIYYSQLDWYHNDYFPRGQTGHSGGRPFEGNFDHYIDFMNGQLTELLSNYGDIAGIWFDGWWDKPDANWRLRETYDLIHELQPAALVGSNHHKAPNPGEDFQMFEKDLPGHNSGGYSADATVGELPLETAETMAHRWGFSLQDKAYKSTRELIHYLVKAAGYNANFLLNVGPMPNGRIQPEFIATLSEIGKWMHIYGESLYGTRAGPVAPQPWGVTTQKDNTVFVHILDWKAQGFILPELESKISKVNLFRSGEPLAFKRTEYGTVVQLPESALQEIDIVLQLQVSARE